MPLAMVVFGPLADYVRIEYILIATGVLFILGTVLLIRDKTIKNLLTEQGAEASLENSICSDIDGSIDNDETSEQSVIL